MPVKERIAALGKALLLMMALPLLPGWYFGIWTSHALERSPDNPRNISRPELRGSLRDRAGRLLAYSEGRKRIYPYGAAAAPLVGYFDVRLGTSGLENAFDGQLQGRQRPGDLLDGMGIAPLQRVKGPDVVVTIDAELQKYCYEQLSGFRGAIVLLHIPTGEVLAAASSPSYDPRTLGDNWDDLSKDPRTPLFHRGLAGLYSPGSTFKVLTMIAALSEKVVTTGSTFYCSGGLPIGDFTMQDSHGGHGNISLEEALAQSCNVTFGGIGLRLKLPRLEKWMLASKVLEASFDLPGMAKGLPPLREDSEVSTAQAAIGQGSFLVTPAAMARLTALVARKGVDIPPKIYRAEQRGQKFFLNDKPVKQRRLVDAKVAAVVGKAMEAVVERGTGGGAAIKGQKVAGKTGTAENPRGASDAWFVGYAPAQRPLFAVCVMFENRGYGGTYSAPVAAKVLQAALKTSIAEPQVKPGRKTGQALGAKSGAAAAKLKKPKPKAEGQGSKAGTKAKPQAAPKPEQKVNGKATKPTTNAKPQVTPKPEQRGEGKATKPATKAKPQAAPRPELKPEG